MQTLTRTCMVVIKDFDHDMITMDEHMNYVKVKFVVNFFI